MPDSALSAISTGYLAALEQRYGVDPDGIDPDWRYLFDFVRRLEAESAIEAQAARSAALGALFRTHGHLVADLDPLGLMDREALPAGPLTDDAGLMSSPLAEHLRRTYCGTLALETGHIDDPALRDWTCTLFEAAARFQDVETRRGVMERLTAAEEFERFMALKFPAKKRFGAEGAECLVPMLDRLLRGAAAAGVTDVVIGAMHRGRLNMLANVVGKPLAELLATFKGAYPFAAAPPVAADVPYHFGHDAELTFGDRTLRVTMLPNPSHLEAINPVALGRVRARQDRAGDPRQVLAVLLHTDASVIGQGVVAETIQLGMLPGFTTAGTIHLIVNNQIGFTTERAAARSSRYCTGAWKAVDSLILHVNGDDPDAAIRSVDLALAFRQEQGRDAVVDLVCYRRNGHNEIDEPRFTQPQTYRAIDEHPTTAALYGARLAHEGVLSSADVEHFTNRTRATLEQAYELAATYRPNQSGYPAGDWAPYDPGRGTAAEPVTGVPLGALERLLVSLSSIPDEISVDRKVERIVRERLQSKEAGVPWAVGEALAFATLLADGTAVRLSGQDAVRGAFSHRHLALTDSATGRRHVTLNHLGGPQARFEAIDSPLSEYAVMGFEYGYSLERPDMLVLWEAQFGDFANGAQIMIDQFLVTAEEKWRQPSGLVMLLPHGLEGQGPEHSSARIERFLQLAARDNIQVAQPTTPANYFHLLRRQILCRRRKPLVVMSPKTLLRLPEAVSPWSLFGPDEAFRPIIVSAGPAAPRQVLLCSGKIAYALERERHARDAGDVAVVRIERLYPLPTDELLGLVRAWPGARFVWVQEEPRNMGAWSFIDRSFDGLLGEVGARQSRLSCVCRPESPSPAGSFHGDHEHDQRQLVERAFLAREPGECADMAADRPLK